MAPHALFGRVVRLTIRYLLFVGESLANVSGGSVVVVFVAELAKDPIFLMH